MLEISKMIEMGMLKATEFTNAVRKAEADPQIQCLQDTMLVEEYDGATNSKLEQFIHSPILNLQEDQYLISHPFKTTMQCQGYLAMQAGANPIIYNYLLGLYALLFYQEGHDAHLPITLKFVTDQIGMGKVLSVKDLFCWWKSSQLSDGQCIYDAIPYAEYFTKHA